MAYPKAPTDRAKYWENQISYARKGVKPVFDACQVLLQQYYGEAATEREQATGDGGEEVVRRTKVGIVYGWIDQTLANMLDRAPVFQCFPENRESAQRVDPADPGSLTRAGVTAKINNYIYRETNQLRVDERVALDALTMPYGVAKIGYTLDFDSRMQELFQPGIDMVLDDAEEENLFLSAGQPMRVLEENDHKGHMELHKAALSGEPLFGVVQDVTELGRVALEDHIHVHKLFLDRPAPSANANVQYEFPFAVRWPSDMFLTDSISMEGVQDARWIAFGWELPVEEVQANPNYENTAELVPSRWKDAPPTDPEMDWSDGLDMVRGWEIWARRFPVGHGKFRDLFLTVAEGSPLPLQYEEEWPYDRIDDYPGEALSFHNGFRRWFHKPPLLMGGGDTTQALANEILDSYLSIVRKQKNVWLVDPNTGITTKILQDVMDAPDVSAVEVPGLSEAQGRSIVPLPFHQVPPEKGELLSVIQNMFDRSVGTPQPMQMPNTNTATEASIMEKRNTSRENRRSQLLSEFQIRKQRKMWQILCQYRPERLYLIDKSALQFVELTSDLARGEYNFTMDVTSHSTALAVERSQWMDLLNLFAGLTPVMIETFGMPPNLPELARRLLVRGFNEKVVEEILPMLDQAAKAMQQGGAPQGAPSIMEGQGSGAEFMDPGAQAAQMAVRDGRMVDRGIGPLQRDSFNRETPDEGRQQGEAART